MRAFFDIAIFTAGFGACWASKNSIVRLVTGGEALIKALEVKIGQLKARL